MLKIIVYKAQFKNGLLVLLKVTFSDFTLVPVFPYAPNLSLMNIHWIAGFINADGSFTMVISKASKMYLGENCSIGVSIVQHNKSLKALDCVAEVISCGKLYAKSSNAS